MKSKENINKSTEINDNNTNISDNNQNQQQKTIKLSPKTRFVMTILLAIFVGVVNGLFGGGGGMLVVPLLTIVCGLNEQKAHSSAILTILPLSIVSGIVYLIRGDFEWATGGYVSIGVILGGILGTFVMKKLSNNTLAVIFYAIMIFAGISMLVNKF